MKNGDRVQKGQKLADLDAFVARQDKEWYADRNPKTNEPTMTAQMFFTVYYAEKGDKKEIKTW